LSIAFSLHFYRITDLRPNMTPDLQLICFTYAFLDLHGLPGSFWTTFRGYRGGSPPPFRPGNPALCGSCPL